MINWSPDFTFSKYENLCRTIKVSKINCIRVKDWLSLSSHHKLDPCIVLRHDVDRCMSRALHIAELEASYGIFSTYYFRIPRTWKPEQITRFSKMGHEVGFHYESLDKAKGILKKAEDYFKNEVKLFKSYFELKTISMHGNPLTNYDNRDFIKDDLLSELDIIGEAYLSFDFSQIMYFTDTGRSWAPNIYNIKDHIPSGQKYMGKQPIIKSTNELINFISKSEFNIYINTHPERWTGNSILWFIRLIYDYIINILKIIIKLIYKCQKN